MPSIDSTTHDHGTDFLGDLEPSIKRFPYQGKRQFNNIMNREYKRRAQSSDPIEKWSEWVLFTDLDEETLTRDFLNSADETANCPSYDSSLCLLLTKTHLSRTKLLHRYSTRCFPELFNQWGLTVLYDPWETPRSRAQAATRSPMARGHRIACIAVTRNTCPPSFSRWPSLTRNQN